MLGKGLRGVFPLFLTFNSAPSEFDIPLITAAEFFPKNVRRASAKRLAPVGPVSIERAIGWVLPLPHPFEFCMHCLRVYDARAPVLFKTQIDIDEEEE
jgi:hypothetical protein